MASDCPYCRSIPGVGSGVVKEGRLSGFNAPIFMNDFAAVVPTLGLLVPGYLLIVSRAHVASMASLARAGGVDVWAFATEIARQLSPAFGPYLIFESTKGLAGLAGGGCVAHAHLHLIPATHSFMAEITERFPQAVLGWNLSEFADVAYLAFAADGSPPMVVREPRVQSQWIRLQFARHLGREEHYDWGAVSGRENLSRTFTDSIGLLPHGNSGLEVAIKALLIHDDRVLLARRLQDDDGGSPFELPGGRMQANESAEACFQREVREETGVLAHLGEWQGCWWWSEGGKTVVAHAFDGSVSDPTTGQDLQPPGEGLGPSVWLPLTQVNRVSIRPEHREILQHYLARRNLT